MQKQGCVAITTIGVCLLLLNVVRADDKVDPTGIWKWKREIQGQQLASTLTIRLEGKKVTGSYQTTGIEKVKIKNGKLEGNKLSFEVEPEFEGQQMSLVFEGKLSGNGITGKIEVASQELEWKATRSFDTKALLGIWKMKVEAGDRTLEPSITFSADDGKLTGIHTREDQEHTVKDIAFDGRDVTFKIDGERDGNSWSVVYKGRVKGDSIAGTIDYDFGENQGTIDFTGSRQKEG